METARYEKFNNRGVVDGHNETVHCSGGQYSGIDFLLTDNVV